MNLKGGFMKKNMKEIVKRVLIENTEARKDDFVLIYEVVNHITGVAKFMMLKDIALSHTEYGIPSFESITRARRQVQKEMPELKDANTVSIRKQEEKEFREEYRR